MINKVRKEIKDRIDSVENKVWGCPDYVTFNILKGKHEGLTDALKIVDQFGNIDEDED